MERVMGIEPTSSAWKAEVLPLNYTRLLFLLPALTSLFKARKNSDSLDSQTVRIQNNSLCDPTFLVSRGSSLCCYTGSQPILRLTSCLVEGVGFEPT